MLFNLHTHTHFSDGSSPPEEYIAEAIRQGFHTLGFSDHSPVPFENNFALKEERLGEYIETINSYPSPIPSPTSRGGEKGVGYEPEKGVREVNILLGLEIDYIPDITKPIEDYRKMNCFDFFIGSVHLVKNGSSSDLWFIDGPDIAIYDEGLENVFNNDIKKAVTAYYHQINRMIETQKPDIIGHLDKIRMYNRNRYFMEDEKWYRELVDEALRVIKENGTIVEVNTRGIYKKRSDALFPGMEILKTIQSMDIPVIISSDAHRPEELSYGFEETRKILIDLGFKHLSLKTKKGWKEVSLS